MQTKYKILILVLIIILLLIIGIFLYLFLKKPKVIEKPKDIELPKVVEESQPMQEESVNPSIIIDTYNKNYNMNYPYFLLENSQIKNMDSTMATVINEPKIENIIVNDKSLIIYTVTLTYNIKNYMKDKIGNIISTGGGSVGLPKELNTNSSTPILVTADILTTKKINKDDNFLVYYKYGFENSDRIAPPFLLEDYGP
jgi:uncharacterized protein with ATP-grasp and redox domains